MLLPGATYLGAWVAGHVDGCPCQGDTGSTPCHTVTDLTASTGGSSIEGFDGRREVVRLGLEAKDAVDVLTYEVIRLVP